jgi:hypothetical protein
MVLATDIATLKASGRAPAAMAFERALRHVELSGDDPQDSGDGERLLPWRSGRGAADCSAD